ncbi:phage protein Gp27 family protein [Achromobacter xylosoxidans]|uniref:phage protein Gp27 family protein n=1 Tax=Alcaligenes xylosoxydans xylosoxydans TaxID=85698 RepID=UPI001EEC1AC5|nr:phage protein Gp27 family protein [Achromobacter xylosoxidans]
MAGKSSIHRLPEEIKAYIEAQLATGCHTLDSLISDLREQFPVEANAGQLPSRSAIGRYGQKLERRLAAIRASTEAAKLIRAHAGDELDARSEALTALVQTEPFEAIIELQEADDTEDPGARVEMLSKAAKNIATLARSSVNLKRFQSEAEEAGRRKLLAQQEANLQEVARARGMDAGQVDFWRREFLGINAS